MEDNTAASQWRFVGPLKMQHPWKGAKIIKRNKSKCLHVIMALSKGIIYSVFPHLMGIQRPFTNILLSAMGTDSWGPKHQLCAECWWGDLSPLWAGEQLLASVGSPPRQDGENNLEGKIQLQARTSSIKCSEMLPQEPCNEIQGHPKVQSVVPSGQAWIGRPCTVEIQILNPNENRPRVLAHKEGLL